MATKVRMTLRLAWALPCPWAELGKYGLRQEPTSVRESPCPLKKKTSYSRCEIIFQALNRRGKNTSNKQDFRSCYVLNLRIRDILFHYYFQFLVF